MQLNPSCAIDDRLTVPLPSTFCSKGYCPLVNCGMASPVTPTAEAGNEYEVEDESDEEERAAALASHNIGDGAAGCGCCIRTLVSKKKRRFINSETDLDLSYISDRIIAMGFPASGWETLWRNPADAVKFFLESRHRGHYRIWNLCCERDREYGSGGFGCEVERFAWADHTPPPFAMVSGLLARLVFRQMLAPGSCCRCCPLARAWNLG
jgi:hypothetical protein